MGFFRKAKPMTPSKEELSHDIRVEVVVEKEANKQVVNKAKEANKVLNDLLEANHFTIKIYRATHNPPVEGKS
jgi:hypothetical protein